MLDPVDEILKTLRSFTKPEGRNETVEDAVCKLFKNLGHTNLTDKCSLQIHEGLLHNVKKLIESFKFLKKHNLRWRWCVDLLFDVVNIEGFGELVKDLLGNSFYVFFLVDSTRRATVTRLH